MSRSREFIVRAVLALVVVAAATTPSAIAQAPPIHPGSEFSLSIGVFEPSDEGDLFSEKGVYNTCDCDNWGNVIGGLAFAIHANPYLDVQFSGHYYYNRADRSYRDFVDDFGDPVFQSVSLYEFPAEVSFKFLPMPRMAMDGGRNGPVLRTVVPYFGGGAGVVFWNYRREGLFVNDPVFPDIAYYDERSTDGVAMSAHVLGGVEFEINPWIALWIEGGYRWAEDDIQTDFGRTLDNVQLGGGSLTFGTSFRF